MPSPSPSAVVRLMANTDTSVIRPSTASSANVPTIAQPPISSGSSAATTEPKTSSNSSKVSGIATDSARTSDFVTCVLMSP